MPQDEPVGKKTTLAEEGAPGEKRKFTIFERRDRQLRKNTRMLLEHAERKLEM